MLPHHMLLLPADEICNIGTMRHCRRQQAYEVCAASSCLHCLTSVPYWMNAN